MRVSTWSRAAVLLLAAQQMGCSEDVRFNPSGCDVQVCGTWTVDGQAPTADTCKDIRLVELAIINEDQDQFWSEDELLLVCEQDGAGGAGGADSACGPGSYYYLDSSRDTRDRCGGSGEVLDDEDETGKLVSSYKYRWRAITDLNFIVDCSPILNQPVEETDGGTQLVLKLPSVNFVTNEAGVMCPETN